MQNSFRVKVFLNGKVFFCSFSKFTIDYYTTTRRTTMNNMFLFYDLNVFNFTRQTDERMCLHFVPLLPAFSD